ncbi:DUF3429 domain-containing protein [Vibrio astriarenae]
MRNILGYMGLIPYIALPAAVLLLNDMERGLAIYSYFAYSAGIAIFMSGAIWGRIIESDGENSTALLMSNLITLFVIALSTISFHNFTVFTIGLILAHTFNWFFEPKDNEGYLKLRKSLTAMVLISHLVMVGILYSSTQ